MPLQSNIGNTRESTGNPDTLLKSKIIENCASREKSLKTVLEEKNHSKLCLKRKVIENCA